MKAGDLVNHIMKGGWGIGMIVGVRSVADTPHAHLNVVYNVAWQSIGTIGWAWDYDLEVINESR